MLVSGHPEEKQQQHGEPHGSRAQEVLQTSPDIRRGKNHQERFECLESARQQVPQPISRLSSRHSIELRRRIRRRRIDLLPLTFLCPSSLMLLSAGMDTSTHLFVCCLHSSIFGSLFLPFGSSDGCSVVASEVLSAPLFFFYLHLRRILLPASCF